MCQLKPGLRCKPHISSDLRTINSRISKKIGQLADENLSQNRKTTIRNSLEKDYSRLEDLKIDYGMTPTGQEELINSGNLDLAAKYREIAESRKQAARTINTRLNDPDLLENINVNDVPYTNLTDMNNKLRKNLSERLNQQISDNSELVDKIVAVNAQIAKRKSLQENRNTSPDISIVLPSSHNYMVPEVIGNMQEENYSIGFDTVITRDGSWQYTVHCNDPETRQVFKNAWNNWVDNQPRAEMFTVHRKDKREVKKIADSLGLNEAPLPVGTYSTGPNRRRPYEGTYEQLSKFNAMLAEKGIPVLEHTLLDVPGRAIHYKKLHLH